MDRLRKSSKMYQFFCSSLSYSALAGLKCVFVCVCGGGGGGEGGGARDAGAFSRDFTIDISPQCKAFTRALQTEK